MPDDAVKNLFFSFFAFFACRSLAEIAGHTHLHPFVTDDIKGANHAEHKLDDFAEALVSNTPRAVDEEDQVGFGTFADCEGRAAGTCWDECLCDANTINACLNK